MPAKYIRYEHTRSATNDIFIQIFVQIQRRCLSLSIRMTISSQQKQQNIKTLTRFVRKKQGVLNAVFIGHP